MSEAIILQGQFENEIKPHHEALDDYLSSDAKEYTLASDQDLQEAADIINEIKKRRKSVEAIEKTATAPAMESVKVIRSWFSTVKERLDEASKLWKSKIDAYLLEQTEKQNAVQLQLESAAKAGDTALVRAELAKLEVAPVTDGLTVVKIVKWKVANIELVPAEFLTIDPDKIEAAKDEQLRQIKGILPIIPGITFYYENQIKATGR